MSFTKAASVRGRHVWPNSCNISEISMDREEPEMLWSYRKKQRQITATQKSERAAA